MADQIVDVKYLERLAGALDRAVGNVRDSRADSLSGDVADALGDVHALFDEIVTALDAVQTELQTMLAELRTALADLRGQPAVYEQPESGNGETQ